MAHSVFFVPPFPSFMESSHIQPCLFLTPPDFVLPSCFSLVHLCLLGQCGAYKNNRTCCCLYLEGEAGILPRETSPIISEPTAADPTGASLTSGWGNVSRGGGSALLLPSLLASLTSKPAFDCRDQDDRAGPWTGNVPADRD